MRFLISNNFGVENVPIDDSVLTGTQETDYDEVLKHQKKYTKLLSVYTNTTRLNLYVKILFKIIFFIIAIWIWIYMINLFKSSFDVVLKMINGQNSSDNYINHVINLMSTFVPSLVSLITSFIVIPKVIAKYLFNIKEENSMVEIIKSLQTYDDELYKHRYNEELLAHKQYANTNIEVESECSEEKNAQSALDESNKLACSQ